MTNGDTGITWAALLAQWMEFAKASGAAPRDEAGDRWRKATPSIITLQAVAMAMAELDRLSSREERALALDKADMLIRQHAAALNTLWAKEPMSFELITLIGDARRALSAARGAGVEWTVEDEELIAAHPAELIDAVRSLGFEGDLLLPCPGVPLFRGAPAGFARDRFGGEPEGDILRIVGVFLGERDGVVGEAQPVAVPRQVYRQFDFGAGGPVRDLVVPMDATLPPGQPLLVPVIDSGEACPVPLPPRAKERQAPLPVVFAESEPG